MPSINTIFFIEPIEPVYLMDLYQLRYFLAIAESGSFTKAAERLLVSQPSLSAGIKKLEKELKVRLLERGGRRTSLTPEGRFFLERAQAIFKEYDAALHGLKAFQSQPILRLGVPRTIPISILSRVIAAFKAQFSDLSLALSHAMPESQQDLLEEGGLDLVVTAVNGPNPARGCELLFQQPLMLAVPCGHNLARRGSVRLADLDQQPYIERVACEVWQAYPDLFETVGIHPNVVYRADHEEWVIALVSVGLGISIAPVWPELNEITYIPLSDQSLCRTVGLRSRSSHDSEYVRELRIFLSSHDWLSGDLLPPYPANSAEADRRSA